MNSGNGNTKILIVGAGAMGMTLGYHLHLAGMQINFLVKPERAPNLEKTQTLYSFDDNSLKHFCDYKVITSPEAVKEISPDYVLVTLDAISTTSAQGSALLKDLGQAVRSTSAVMIGGGVGMGLREHYIQTTGLPSGQIIMGVLGSFAYQVQRVQLPLHPPTDPKLLSQADIAYRHYSKTGFMLDSTSPIIAKRFAAIYDRNGISKCAILEPHLYEILTKIPFPIYLGSKLLDWCPVEELPKHKLIWQLSVGAAKEIAKLNRHGFRGKVVSLIINEWTVAKMWQSIDKGSYPLDYQAFNAFHHGGKVAEQDIVILQKCLEAGNSEGKPMKALHELLMLLNAEK